jgi:hypothetical protein
MNLNFPYRQAHVSISLSDNIWHHYHNIEFSRQCQHSGPGLWQDFQRESGFSMCSNLPQPIETLHRCFCDLNLFVVYSDEVHAVSDGYSFFKLCRVIECMLPVAENITRDHDSNPQRKTLILNFRAAGSVDILSNQPIKWIIWDKTFNPLSKWKRTGRELVSNVVLIHWDVSKPIWDGWMVYVLQSVIKGGMPIEGFWCTPFFMFIPLIQIFNRIKNIISKYITI